ncbi:MAG: hypothetical protein K1X91_12545 [Bacteriodetes bacterium]|nr:hypothetical protein [Bacteroidota bacterium]
MNPFILAKETMVAVTALKGDMVRAVGVFTKPVANNINQTSKSPYPNPCSTQLRVQTKICLTTSISHQLLTILLVRTMQYVSGRAGRVRNTNNVIS